MSGELSGRRIGLLTASASRLGGGVSEVVMAHAKMIGDLGGEAKVFALADEHTETDRARYAGAALQAEPVLGPALIGFAPSLATQLVKADLDCLHLHGIWMYPSRAATVWARRTGRPYLISPHGMLDPWITGRGRLKKAIARLGYERASWRAAHVFHALTRREADDIARESGRADTIVIPNAGPAPDKAAAPVRALDFAYLGRIHPKKNVLALVEAWKRLAANGTLGEARLSIAGWGAAEDIAALEAALAQAPGSARFIGAAYGEAKQALLAGARFLVLPSHSEGLPMAILEAWAQGTPTIMTSECNLPEGIAAGAALECGFDVDAIAATLARALAMDVARWQSMSRAAMGLASGPFSADTIALKWAETYTGLMDNRQNRAA